MHAISHTDTVIITTVPRVIVSDLYNQCKHADSTA